ncbi:MAG: hypothetical protein AAF004_06060 [Pseudomonadota bacterium]
MRLLPALLIILLSSALGNAAALAQQPALEGRDDSIKYACLVSGKLENAEVDEQWCQCQNDYYAELLTDADWNTYSEDYYALQRAKSSQRSTPPNSYERFVKLGDAHCQKCMANDYQGCLNDDGRTPSTGAYARILSNLRDGQFEDLQNDLLFKNFYVNYVVGYSAYCGDRIQNYVDKTVTWTEWQGTDHIWYQTGQTTNVTRIDARLVDNYKDYEKRSSRASIKDLGEGYLEARKRNELPTQLFRDTVSKIVEPVVFMRRHLQGQCDTPDVRTAYENLYRFSVGKTALVVAEFVAERERAAAYAKQREAEVTDAVMRSRARAIEIYARQREQEALGPQKQFDCGDVYRSTQETAPSVKSFTAPDGVGFQTFTGGWRGTFNNEEMELAVWAMPGGSSAIGFSYFPKYDCLMTARLRGKGRRPGKGEPALMRLTMYSPNWRADNCASMVIDDRDGEIHFFSAYGYLDFAAGDEDFTWNVAGGKLSRHSPMQCDDYAVDFRRTSVSPEFHRLLQQYEHPDRGAPKRPASFLDDISSP